MAQWKLNVALGKGGVCTGEGNDFPRCGGGGLFKIRKTKRSFSPLLYYSSMQLTLTHPLVITTSKPNLVTVLFVFMIRSLMSSNRHRLHLPLTKELEKKYNIS